MDDAPVISPEELAALAPQIDAALGAGAVARPDLDVAAGAASGRTPPHDPTAADVATALSELQELPGVGPWTASHILFRGAALPDGLPTAEPRVLHGLAAAYGLDAPTDETLATLGVRWRPFRMWVCVLLARHLARAEGGRGWRHPGLARERAAAGRKLRRT